MITQRVRVLNNTTNVLYFNKTSTFNKLDLYPISSLPAWIVATYSPFITKLTLTPTTVGTYTYYFTESSSPPLTDACLIIEVVDSLTDLSETCSSSNNITLVWITREGGIATYIFDQRKDFKGIIGDVQTFDNNGTVKYINRGKNFIYKVVYKTGISDEELDLLESLRYSIQAWEHNPITRINIPILLDSNSYDLYSTKTKLNEVNLKYRIATYKEIQNQ
jgi:hypothetical protein